MLGSATFTTLTSSTTMNCAASIRPSTVQGRRTACSSAVCGARAVWTAWDMRTPGGFGIEWLEPPVDSTGVAPGKPPGSAPRVAGTPGPVNPGDSTGAVRPQWLGAFRHRSSHGPLYRRTSHAAHRHRRGPRRHRHRRRSGRPRRGVPPQAARPAVPRRRRRLRDRPRLALPMGLAAALHGGGVRRAARHGVPWRGRHLPDEGRGGRLPRGVRPPLRPARPAELRGTTPHPAQGWLCRRDQPGPAAGPPGRGRNRPVAEAGRPRPVARPGGHRRPAAQLGLSQPDRPPAGPGRRGRRRELRSPDRPRARRQPRRHARSGDRGTPAAAATPGPRPLLVADRAGRGHQDRPVTARAPAAVPRGPGDRHPAA